MMPENFHLQRVPQLLTTPTASLLSVYILNGLFFVRLHAFMRAVHSAACADSETNLIFPVSGLHDADPSPDSSNLDFAMVCPANLVWGNKLQLL